MEETLLILQESQYYSSPLIGRCRTKVDVLKSWSPPGVLIRPPAIGKVNYPSLGNITSFALSLFERISDASIVSNSSRPTISSSPFQIPPAYNVIRGTTQERLSLQIDGFLTDPSQ